MKSMNWHSETCAGSGKPPRSVRHLGEESGHPWAVGLCLVCGRDFISVTRSGMIRAHRRRDVAPTVDDVFAIVRGAQELLVEAMRQLEQLDAN
jgi:hypothetical protein